MSAKLPPFPGFELPTANYYRLPNNWFDLWQQVRSDGRSSRILGHLKWLEYLIKYTWGYQRFRAFTRITLDEFQHGRRKGGAARRGLHMDRGTGLSRSTIIQVAAQLTAWGLVEVESDDHDLARRKRWYRPRLRTADNDAGRERIPDHAFNGFDLPETNYFKVPRLWTDMCAGIKSEVLILVVEYFFRHTWGWHNDCLWLSAEEVAGGTNSVENGTIKASATQ